MASGPRASDPQASASSSTGMLFTRYARATATRAGALPLLVVDGVRFAQLCRDSGLHRRAQLHSAACDLAFAYARPQGLRVLPRHAFARALSKLARDCGTSRHDLTSSMLASLEETFHEREQKGRYGPEVPTANDLSNLNKQQSHAPTPVMAVTCVSPDVTLRPPAEGIDHAAPVNTTPTDSRPLSCSSSAASLTLPASASQRQDSVAGQAVASLASASVEVPLVGAAPPPAPPMPAHLWPRQIGRASCSHLPIPAQRSEASEHSASDTDSDTEHVAVVAEDRQQEAHQEMLSSSAVDLLPPPPPILLAAAVEPDVADTADTADLSSSPLSASKPVTHMPLASTPATSAITTCASTTTATVSILAAPITSPANSATATTRTDADTAAAAGVSCSTPNPANDPSSDVFVRLSSVSTFTGIHSRRFDKRGRGLGLRGRESVCKGNGTVAPVYHGGVVHDLASICNRQPANRRGVPLSAVEQW